VSQSLNQNENEYEPPPEVEIPPPVSRALPYEHLPLWKKVLQTVYLIFAMLIITIFFLFLLENSRIWKSASTHPSGADSMTIERTNKNNVKEVRHLSPQEHRWITFLEQVTMIGLPAMFIIGILLQWGLHIMIVPNDDNEPPRLE
jgi:uncharacterized protein involved in cysteine biosynthesis